MIRNMNSLSETEILSACRVLFASNGNIDRRFLERIQHSDMKSAYRKKALETHPDRFVMFGHDYQKLCSERFIAVTKAFETLNAYIELRNKGFTFNQEDETFSGKTARNPHYHRQKPEASRYYRNNTSYSADFSYWRGDLPRRHLRFGEFLFHSRIIQWKDLIAAIVWQRRQRPRLGEIAIHWGWLTDVELRNCLKAKRLGERIGDTLIRYHLITPFECRVLLRHQQKLQSPLGRYFIDRGLLTEVQIHQLLIKLDKHNRNIR